MGTTHADNAPACATNSFSADTQVLMADGTKKPISEVEEGDLVAASDPETGEDGARRVTDLIVGEGHKRLVEVTVGGETVTAADEHPFFVKQGEDGESGEWVDAGT